MAMAMGGASASERVGGPGCGLAQRTRTRSCLLEPVYSRPPAAYLLCGRNPSDPGVGTSPDSFSWLSVVWDCRLPRNRQAACVCLLLLLGFWLARKVPRWEFWPAWAAYLPLAPYFLYLAAKYRSLTLFTAANPGIPGGGFVGESKSDILRGLDSELIADFELLPKKHAIEAAMAFAGRFGWPVVLKPDVGERGAGVAIIRTVEELEAHLDSADRDTIIHRYVPGLEFGIFYTRCRTNAKDASPPSPRSTFRY